VKYASQKNSLSIQFFFSILFYCMFSDKKRKTTLLRLIAGLIEADSGEIYIGDRRVDKVPPEDRDIGFVFQTFNLLPALTALENIEIALAPTRMSRDERKEKAKTLLQLFELMDKADNLPLELSVGQQQKIAIARALVRDPPLILADEPTGEMDPMTGGEIAAKLVELKQKYRVTVVVASHGTFPYKAASRILFMKDGKIVSQEEAGY
jgi:putative ABC transport system ATP-binding protein